MRDHKIVGSSAVLVLVLALAGCGEAEPEVAQPAAVEDGREGVTEGLSREEISEHAEAVSPEQAEALGIIDSTIFLEDPTISLDTILPVATPPPAAVDR